MRKFSSADCILSAPKKVSPTPTAVLKSAAPHPAKPRSPLPPKDMEPAPWPSILHRAKKVTESFSSPDASSNFTSRIQKANRSPKRTHGSRQSIVEFKNERTLRSFKQSLKAEPTLKAVS